MLSTIIIDDQKICTEMIKDILEKDCPDVRIMDIKHSGPDGIKAIKNINPIW